MGLSSPWLPFPTTSVFWSLPSFGFLLLLGRRLCCFFFGDPSTLSSVRFLSDEFELLFSSVPSDFDLSPKSLMDRGSSTAGAFFGEELESLLPGESSLLLPAESFFSLGFLGLLGLGGFFLSFGASGSVSVAEIAASLLSAGGSSLTTGFSVSLGTPMFNFANNCLVTSIIIAFSCSVISSSSSMTLAFLPVPFSSPFTDFWSFSFSFVSAF